ncbi:MAG: hypothetical protein MUD08_04315 [Cytophagales bacterium]|jgi:hypothetical protein|nr:hypothetical protein [Cytophagales bacterium]
MAVATEPKTSRTKKDGFKKGFVEAMAENQRNMATEAKAESAEEYKKKMKKFGKAL